MAAVPTTGPRGMGLDRGGTGRRRAQGDRLAPKLRGK